MKSILDPGFVYTDAAHTNLRKTFARIRREQAQIAKAKAEQDAREQARRVITPIRKEK